MRKALGLIACLIVLVLVAGVVGYLVGEGKSEPGASSGATTRTYSNPFSRALREQGEHNPFSQAEKIEDEAINEPLEHIEEEAGLLP